MNKLLFLSVTALAFFLFSCEKEYSTENSGNNGSDQIVGVDCRLNKIIYTDTATKKGIGSIAADINSLDIVTRITQFDSVSNTIGYITIPTYLNDTIFINADEYFVTDANKRISKLHGLIDQTDPFSLQFDVFYLYNPAGNLVTKNYFLSIAPTIPFYRVDYTYAFGNLTHMTATDLASGDLDIDADLSYFTNIIPRRYLYIFPDEVNYSYFNQFYDFGVKNYNAIKKVTLRNYDPGNVVRDSVVTDFSNYIMSRDSYVFSVQMAGGDMPGIPASAGKLSFYYKCK